MLLKKPINLDVLPPTLITVKPATLCEFKRKLTNAESVSSLSCSYAPRSPLTFMKKTENISLQKSLCTIQRMKEL